MRIRIFHEDREKNELHCSVFFFFYAEKWEASCDLETEILIWLHISTCTCSQIKLILRHTLL